MALGLSENHSYVIRKMQPGDLNLAIEWAAVEGWNPGLYDADAFYSTDPDGFLIGELDGVPVAVISVVKYNNEFGFLGFYIVKPGFRHLGYGIKIWNAGMNYLGNINVGLDGVISQQDNYKKSGFKLAYRNIRFEGIADGKMSDRMIPLSNVSFDELLNYDAALFPVNRSSFLEKWISQPQSIAYGIYDRNKLAGYGVIRTCRKGFKIGPLFADSGTLAEELLNALTSSKKGEMFYLDVPEVNIRAVSLAKKNNMSVVFETARMYTGEFPSIDLSKIFGITTFELG